MRMKKETSFGISFFMAFMNIRTFSPTPPLNPLNPHAAGVSKGKKPK